MVERHEFIRAMRRVATSVSIVTTDGPGGRQGATISAFVSVSADPPSFLLCLRSDSRMCQAVHANRTLCVNVLSEDCESIARRFAGADDAHVTSRFEGISFISNSNYGPVFAGATSFSGTLTNVIHHGTHDIIICNVELVSEGSELPLAYLAGRYRRISDHPSADLVL